MFEGAQVLELLIQTEGGMLSGEGNTWNETLSMKIWPERKKRKQYL